jgi:hypothetical protein
MHTDIFEEFKGGITELLTQIFDYIDINRVKLQLL